ncbi:hypothetical protein K438DRAFT_1776191 [Mycena galopus ATCC 62051]|nr:hypothetical protein K438DRAFT_1776191 [Mycena galopus ATCC 62051]
MAYSPRFPTKKNRNAAIALYTGGDSNPNPPLHRKIDYAGYNSGLKVALRVCVVKTESARRHCIPNPRRQTRLTWVAVGGPRPIMIGKVCRRRVGTLVPTCADGSVDVCRPRVHQAWLPRFQPGSLLSPLRGLSGIALAVALAPQMVLNLTHRLLHNLVTITTASRLKLATGMQQKVTNRGQPMTVDSVYPKVCLPSADEGRQRPLSTYPRNAVRIEIEHAAYWHSGSADQVGLHFFLKWNVKAPRI